ncbi:MAG: GtrA family protein [Actinomycetes bacterium]
MTVLARLRARFDVVAREAAKFGTVGAVCYVVDIGVYNALHVGLGVGPLTSKVVSSVIAASCAFVGNRQWSFRHRGRTRHLGNEYLLFLVLNAVGLALALLCLGFGYYVLDMRSTLASNIWGNVIGTGLGTAFRFWSYRRYLWVHPAAVVTAAEDGDVAAAAAVDLAHVEGPTSPEGDRSGS